MQRAAEAVARGEELAPVRPISGNVRAFRVMVRNAMFQKVQLASRDQYQRLAALEGGERPPMKVEQWEAALGAYWDEHEHLDAGPDARSPELFVVDTSKPREWTVRQIINDPEGNHDWAIVAIVDLDASDAAGEPVIRTQSFACG